MTNHGLLTILIAAPLLGFLFNGLRFRTKNGVLAGVVASFAVLVSFGCAVTLFQRLHEAGPHAEAIRAQFFQWITVADFNVNFSFMVDHVSALMSVVS